MNIKPTQEPNAAEIIGSIGSALGGIVGSTLGAIASGVSQMAGDIAEPIKPVVKSMIDPLIGKPGESDEVPVTTTPNQEEISQRAWIIYVSEGYPEGRSLDHWVRAERELSHGNAS